MLIMNRCQISPGFSRHRRFMLGDLSVREECQNMHDTRCSCAYRLHAWSMHSTMR